MAKVGQVVGRDGRPVGPLQGASKAYDIAMMELKDPFPEWNDQIKPILINTKELPAGMDCIVSGWGRTVDVSAHCKSKDRNRHGSSHPSPSRSHRRTRRSRRRTCCM